MAINLNFTGLDLGSLGTSLGALLTNLAEPLFTFMIYMIIATGVGLLIYAIFKVIVGMVKFRK